MDKYATDSDFGLGLLKILGLQGKAIKEINISVCAHKKVEVTCTYLLQGDEGDQIVEQIEKYGLRRLSVEVNPDQL